ncbi:MAG: hypothetical protein GYB64_04950 [Chloroflexi bacterium]|nr:hypothetical protein [Chloroflexota bacterium]
MYHIWQGYHHEWEYNHRVNRFGSYIRQENGTAFAGHTAASGTGADVAHFTEFSTGVKAEGVAYQTGTAEVVVECQRTNLTPFRVRVDDVELAPELRGRDRYVVVLNGFDIFALEHADKLITFDLEMTEPVVTDGDKLRFNALGNLCFDCRSPECQLWPMRLEVEDVNPPKEPALVENKPVEELPRHQGGIQKDRVDRAVKWLKDQVVRFTGLEDVKRSVIGKDEDALRRRLFRILGKRFFLKFLKWRITTPYVVRIHYLILAADSDALTCRETPVYTKDYVWDMDNEIDLETHGTQTITLPVEREASTLAFKHLYLNVTLDEEHGTTDPIQWGKGMHVLGWSMAVRDIQVNDGQLTARLDLFYKCWSAAMNEVITLTTWGAFRAAGRAEIAARLLLLQFKDAVISPQTATPGAISWPGGGLNATRHPRAVDERPIAEAGDEPVS